MAQAITTPTADFVTSSLSGAITNSATSATVGTSLSIPATNGVLQIDYDSTVAVGSDTGPETIFYTSYNSGTGALSGITRGVAGTTGVAHNNGASVQCAWSTYHLLQGGGLSQILESDAWANWTPTFTGFSANPSVTVSRYIQIGKMVFFALDMGEGTSNATTFTITLPVTAKSTCTVLLGDRGDNGVHGTIGNIRSVAGSNTANCYANSSTATWTATGGKSIIGIGMYEAN